MLLGILNSAAAGGAGADFEWIETVNGSGLTTLSITGIPQDYTHLHIRATLQCTQDEVMGIRFNGDTAANYSRHAAQGQGNNSVQMLGYANVSEVEVGEAFADNVNSSYLGSFIMDIYDYANTSKYKTFQFMDGQTNPDRQQMRFASGNWRNTNAVTSMQFRVLAGTMTYLTNFAIYGVRA
jgi:hypothetical protein